jgi:Putative peptidoglycan binding domain
MLPIVMTARKAVFATLAAVSVAAVPAAPAHAWGDKEQAFVAGVATAVIIDEILKNSRKAGETRRKPQVTYADRPSVSTGSIYRTPAARAFQSYSLSERKAIQRTLRAWGYYRGGIDGTFGPGTYTAIKAFASDEGALGKLSTTAGAFAVYDGLIF